MLLPTALYGGQCHHSDLLRSFAVLSVLKVTLVNDDIDRMRHSATRSLLERRDVIVVASVSHYWSPEVPFVPVCSIAFGTIYFCGGEES